MTPVDWPCFSWWHGLCDILSAENGGKDIVVMKTHLKELALVAAPTIVLMAMGLVFCWVVPTNAQLYGAGSHFFFTRMACWTGIGLSLPILSLGIPFVAYGGSLVLASLAGLGILCSALTERGSCNEVR